MRHRRRRLGSDHSGDLSSLVRGGVAAPECRKLSQTSVVRGRILVTAPLSQKADERLEQLELGATEVRSLDPCEGLAEELLGLFVPALCGPYSRERGRRRDRRDVLRPHRLTRCDRELLGLVESAQLDEELGEAPLALAERRPVLERLQDSDRLAEDPLGTLALAPPARGPTGVVEGATERPGRVGLRQERRGLFERRFGLFELVPLELQDSEESVRHATADHRSRLLGQLDRLPERRLGLVEL